jgi:hypothetical protein
VSVEQSLAQIDAVLASRRFVFWTVAFLLALSLTLNVGLWLRLGEVNSAVRQSRDNERVLRCVARVDANYQSTVGDGLIAVAQNDKTKLATTATKLTDQIKGLRHLERICR